MQRYISCNNIFHSQKDWDEFNEIIQEGFIFWEDGKMALKDISDFFQTNFSKRDI